MRKTSTVRARRRDRKVMPPTLRYRSVSSSTSRSRKGARLRMRPWLELLLDSQKCSILRWEDRDSKKFSIAWRHASSHGFDPSRHSDLFYMWAEHTGKVKRITKENHSSNKSTFRCALNSLKDCIELTKTGDKRGEGAKRTYQFIEPGHQLYDRKRNRANQRGNKFQMPLKEEEASVSSLDFQEDSSNNSEYHIAEVTTAALNIATPSPDVPEPINESSALLYEAVSRESVVSPSSLSPQQLVTTSLEFPNTDATSGSGQDSQYESLPELSTTSKIYTELQPDGVVRLVLDTLNYGGEEAGSITCKEEPMTPKLPNFAALDIPDIYENLDSINNRSLCCGGNVKVKQNKQETLSQPEFQIDYSLINKLPPQQLLLPPQELSLPSHQLFLPSQELLLPSQQQLLPLKQQLLPSQQQLRPSQQQFLPPERYMAESSVPDYEYPIAVTCVDVSTEHDGLEQSAAVDTFFLQNQNEDNDSRVLIELQPFIDETSYTAMEASDDDLVSGWSQDIFSIGAF